MPARFLSGLTGEDDFAGTLKRNFERGVRGGEVDGTVGDGGEFAAELVAIGELDQVFLARLGGAASFEIEFTIP